MYCGHTRCLVASASPVYMKHFNRKFDARKKITGFYFRFFWCRLVESAHSAWIVNPKTEVRRQWSSILRPSSMILIFVNRKSVKGLMFFHFRCCPHMMSDFSRAFWLTYSCPILFYQMMPFRLLTRVICSMIGIFHITSMKCKIIIWSLIW